MTDYAKAYDWPADPYPAPPTANDLFLHAMRREIIRQRYEAALERKRAREAANFQALWLGLANGILEYQRQKLEIRLSIAESELEMRAA